MGFTRYTKTEGTSVVSATDAEAIRQIIQEEDDASSDDLSLAARQRIGKIWVAPPSKSC